MSGVFPIIRVIVIGIALAVVVVLFSRQEVDPKLRFVLAAAAALYAVRLYLAASHARRRKREHRENTP